MTAQAYAGLGSLANARGSNLALPVAERINGLTAARSYYRKSLGLRRSVNKPATSPTGSMDESEAKRLTVRIAECERQLAQLNRAGRAP